MATKKKVRVVDGKNGDTIRIAQMKPDVDTHVLTLKDKKGNPVEMYRVDKIQSEKVAVISTSEGKHRLVKSAAQARRAYPRISSAFKKLR